MVGGESRQRSSCPISFIKGLTIDSIFTAVAGIVSMCLCLSYYQNTKAHKYKIFLIGQEHRDVIGITTFVIGCLGLLNVVLAVVRINGSLLGASCRIHLNKYTLLVVLTLLGNFSLGLVLTDYKGKLSGLLSSTMKSYLRQTLLAQAALGVGFSSQDNWEYLQLQMKCCGVDSFEDYFTTNISKKVLKEKTIPMSCCGMRMTAEEYPEVDNPAQCIQDASRHIADSVFLHTQGCHVPLVRWLTRHIGVSTALLFLVISLQAVAVLYLSYKGYQASAPPRGSRSR